MPDRRVRFLECVEIIEVPSSELREREDVLDIQFMQGAVPEHDEIRDLQAVLESFENRRHVGTPTCTKNVDFNFLMPPHGSSLLRRRQNRCLENQHLSSACVELPALNA